MQSSLNRLSDALASGSSQHPAWLVEGHATSYSEFDAQVATLASELGREGLASSRLGILLPNVPAFPVALYATWRCGGSALLLNPVNSPREVAEQLEDAAVTTVLTTEKLRKLLPSGCAVLVLDSASGAVSGRAGESNQQTSAPKGGPRRSESEAVIIFTSAIGGRSRGAVLTHRNLTANVVSTIEAMRVTADDRVVGALPFAHAFGLTVCLYAPLSAGATILPVQRFHPGGILDLIQTGSATFVAGVPAMFHALIAVAAKRGVGEHALRLALCGGAPMSLELAYRWEELFGVPLRQGYGLTEASPVCLFNMLNAPNLIGSLGTAYPGVEISIRDMAGRQLPDGEVGELCVRGENVFEGYLGRGYGASLFHDDWLRTGDLADLRDGAVFFRGTVKKMFTRNGFNIYPEEISRVLTEDPRIDEVHVYARPDPIREYEIILGVRVREGSDISEGSIRDLCQAQLASYKQPTEIRILH